MSDTDTEAITAVIRYTPRVMLSNGADVTLPGAAERFRDALTREVESLAARYSAEVEIHYGDMLARHGAA